MPFLVATARPCDDEPLPALASGATNEIVSVDGSKAGNVIACSRHQLFGSGLVEWKKSGPSNDRWYTMNGRAVNSVISRRSWLALLASVDMTAAIVGMISPAKRSRTGNSERSLRPSSSSCCVPRR